jgi:hypothetical protein
MNLQTKNENIHILGQNHENNWKVKNNQRTGKNNLQKNQKE